MLKRVALLIGVCTLASWLCVSIASAAPGAGWQVVGRVQPTVLSPGGHGKLYLYVFDVGAAPGTATVIDTLPAGLTAPEGGEYYTRAGGGSCSGGKVVRCAIEFGMNEVENDKPVTVTIPLEVQAGVADGSQATDSVSVSIGVSATATSVSLPVRFGTIPAGFGFESAAVWASDEDGTLDTQAGSHPYSYTTAYTVNTVEDEYGYGLPAGGEVRGLNVNLPPGLIANAQALPKCPRALFDAEAGEAFKYDEGCPPDSQIGMDWTSLDGIEGGSAGVPVYNLVPRPGVAAEFAFIFPGGVPIIIEARVRSGGDYGVTAHVSNLPEREVLFNSTTIWGEPEASIHTHLETHIAPVPYLTLPTSCEPVQPVSLEALSSWQNESLKTSITTPLLHNGAGEPVAPSGCERLVHFTPTASLQPETSYADTPTGLSVEVKVPQGANPEELATSGLKDTTVTLPEGVVVNPGQATGLVACQPSQENRGGEEEQYDGPPSCPLASKVGEDEIETPLLPDTLKGNVYILGQDPPDLQLLVAASGDGVNLKLIGTVHLNEQTGQLTTTFENTPDTTFTTFRLTFSGGAQAALATPSYCGTYSSTADFVPWATPFVSEAISESAFQIASGPYGTPCENPLPFAPTMTAGATTDQAGGYTDFTMLLQRGDGQQHIERLQFKTPEGLLGMISKVALCQEPQATQGDCPTASQIGHTVAEAGPGPYPFVIPQAGAPPAPIYLTGPYQGAPYGLTIAVPIVAGPFNLGTEIVRAKIEVDPHTSQLTITTTAFPRTVKGIPTDIREIDAVIDKPEFMFNPTNCNPTSFSGTATSFEGATAPLTSHFQVGSCQALKFAPNFKVSTSGKTSRADGASLTAKIVYPVGNLGDNQASSQSNIKAVKVDLPKQLPSRLTTLQKACPAKVFEANPAGCPADSIVGHGKAITPLLPVPVEGPAYFVSHAGEEFPNLIVVLQGDNVTVDLVGDTFINTKTNITSSTFKEVPDVPIQSFELNLPQGPYSALAANTNLCKVKGGLKMPTAFTGQNNAVIHQTTPIAVTGCAKAVKKHKKAKAKGKHKESGKGGKAGK